MPPPADKSEMVEHFIRLWEEAHANSVTTMRMVADIHSVVVYGLRPPKPAVPPNPRGEPIPPPPKQFNPKDLMPFVDALGAIFNGGRRGK